MDAKQRQENARKLVDSIRENLVIILNEDSELAVFWGSNYHDLSVAANWIQNLADKSKGQAALYRIDKALDMVSDLCTRKREWMMSIPARPDYDPDIVISDALSTAKVEIERLRQRYEGECA